MTEETLIVTKNGEKAVLVKVEIHKSEGQETFVETRSLHVHDAFEKVSDINALHTGISQNVPEFEEVDFDLSEYNDDIRSLNSDPDLNF